ncbi:MAG: hypothetical protein ACRCV9_03525, partial [Burkholderiaceae bacterium]
MLSRLIATFAAPIVYGLAGLAVALGVALWWQTARLESAHKEADRKAAAGLQAAINARDAAIQQREQIAAQSADLAARLAARESTLEAVSREKQSAVEKLARKDRACLSAGVVTELNRVSERAADRPGAGGAQAAPAADAARTESASPAAAAGEPAASELDVARWIADAQRQYESCAQ